MPEALPGDGWAAHACRCGYHGMRRPCARVDHDLTLPSKPLLVSPFFLTWNLLPQVLAPYPRALPGSAFQLQVSRPSPGVTR